MGANAYVGTMARRSASTTPAAPSPKRQWAILGALWALSVLVVAYVIAPASVYPLVMDRLGIEHATASWLVSVVYLAMFTSAIPLGIAVDRAGTRRAVAASYLALVAAMCWSAWAGQAGSYPSLLASRFAAGVANVAAWTASVNAVGAVFPGDREATAIGLFSTSVVAGFAVGQFSGPALAAVVGWASVPLVFAGLSLVVVAAFWAIAGPVAGASTGGEPPSWPAFGRVLANRAVWAVGVLAFVAFSLNLFFNNWLPTYIGDRFGLSLQNSGLFAALFPAVGIVARGASGAISDRAFATRRKPVVLGSFAVVTPVVLGFVVVDAVVVLVAFLVVAGFFSQVGLALLFPYVRDLVPASVVGTALAVLNAVGFFGAFSAPLVTGAIIERTGSYPVAFGYAAVLAALGVVVAALVPEPNR